MRARSIFIYLELFPCAREPPYESNFQIRLVNNLKEVKTQNIALKSRIPVTNKIAKKRVNKQNKCEYIRFVDSISSCRWVTQTFSKFFKKKKGKVHFFFLNEECTVNIWVSRNESNLNLLIQKRPTGQIKKKNVMLLINSYLFMAHVLNKELDRITH